jgi:hypothetical protein
VQSTRSKVGALPAAVLTQHTVLCMRIRSNIISLCTTQFAALLLFPSTLIPALLHGLHTPYFCCPSFTCTLNAYAAACHPPAPCLPAPCRHCAARQARDLQGDSRPAQPLCSRQGHWHRLRHWLSGRLAHRQREACHTPLCHHQQQLSRCVRLLCVVGCMLLQLFPLRDWRALRQSA